MRGNKGFIHARWRFTSNYINYWTFCFGRNCWTLVELKRYASVKIGSTSILNFGEVVGSEALTRWLDINVWFDVPHYRLIIQKILIWLEGWDSMFHGKCIWYKKEILIIPLERLLWWIQHSNSSSLWAKKYKHQGMEKFLWDKIKTHLGVGGVAHKSWICSLFFVFSIHLGGLHLYEFSRCG